MINSIIIYRSETSNLAKKLIGKSATWLPSNGYNPLASETGWFAYSVNPNMMIAQGCPNGYFSQYGTVFGCANTGYGILIYEDVYGNQAIWSVHQNVWDINNLVTTNKTIIGAINSIDTWCGNLGSSSDMTRFGWTASGSSQAICCPVHWDSNGPFIYVDGGKIHLATR